MATKCWEGDWRKMIAGGFDRKAESCQYPFDNKTLIINNGDVQWSAFPMDIQIWPNEFFREPVLKFFELKEANVYALGELAAVYHAGGYDYLCYVQGDCLISPASDWVTPAIKTLEENPHISVVSPASDCNTWHDPKTHLDQFFSDHAFLIRVSEFRKPIYDTEGVIPEFPPHGGQSFEHMAAKYLRKAGKYRYIMEDVWVNHPAY